MVREFYNRRAAGEALSNALIAFKGTDAVVLALPRGGAPVAYEVAKRLGLPLGVLVCRKLGVPGHVEYAFGAIAEGGVWFIDDAIVQSLGLSPIQIATVQNQEVKILAERVELFRPGQPPPDLTGRTALLIDDGIATGATARAACLAAKKFGATRVVVAVPVAPMGATNEIPEADEVLSLIQPQFFVAVGNHYEIFDQVSDAEVLRILREGNSFT